MQFGSMFWHCLPLNYKLKLMKYDGQKLKVNTQLHRLELEVEGNIAFIEYKLDGDTLILIHTEVPAALEGKGAGSAIVQKALQYAKDNNYKIVPICPFVQSYLKRHKEWRDIIVPAAQKLFNGH
jgi:predicted GNAT family acetyltransferase